MTAQTTPPTSSEVDEASPPPKAEVASDAATPFVESEHRETKMEYDPRGGFAWPMRIIWVGFAALCVWYVASFYVPSLKAWLPWKPIVP